MLLGKSVTVVLGGGRSMAGFDLERLRSLDEVVAIKGSIFSAPWATVGFGLDMPRYMEWRDKLRDVRMPVYWAAPDPAALEKSGNTPGCMRFLKRDSRCGFDPDLQVLYGGGSSGYGGLGLAVALGARRIILLGYDYSGEEADGKAVHYNAEHYKQQRVHKNAQWKDWAANFKVLVKPFNALGVRVVNANPDSAIEAFTKVDSFDTALSMLT